jgi:transposase-like protein
LHERIVNSYDNQLNVVKDTEMKIDTTQMFANMQKIMDNCPRCKQTMQAQGQTQPPGQAQARE